MEYDPVTNIIKVKENPFFDCESIYSFDNEMNNFIKKLDIDINSNWVIQIGPIEKYKRHILHTFKRRGLISIYSIGKSKKGHRVMIIEPGHEYIEYIIKKFSYKEKVVKLIEEEIELLKNKLLKMVIESM